jgi:hypothetical protein
VFNKSPAPPPVTIKKSSRVILDAGDLHSSIVVPQLGNLSSLPFFLPFNKSTLLSLLPGGDNHSAQAVPQHGHIHLVTPWRRERKWTEHRMPDAPHGLWISTQRILMVAVRAPGSAAAPNLGAAMLVTTDFAATAFQCGGGPSLAVSPCCWC